MDRVTVHLRRALFAVPVVFLTGLGVALFHRVIAEGGISPAEYGMIGLFTATLIWIVIWFWNAMLGLATVAFARNPASAAAPILASLDRNRPIRGRVAVVMPIHNEDPARTFQRLEATYRSLAENCASGNADRDRFDFHLLSDTTDLAVAEEEIIALARLRNAVDPDRLFYRRRDTNTGRKAGNIMDFCRGAGADYDYMVVLDADSVMSGRLLRDLALLMDANPDAGIIQTVPRPILATSVFGRIQQFASRTAAEIVSAGVSFWQLGDANYFGHNAIIRLGGFSQHCGLPALNGAGPLSGEVLSHDFVEAAFIRRAGYTVWNIPVGDGSYEEVPPTLLDYARRDRRWCQGNLQHIFILPARGLNAVSRFHLLSGIMSYMASPLWMGFLLLSLFELIARWNPDFRYQGPGSGAFTLIPNGWNATALILFGAIMTMLILPKLIGGLAIMLNREERAGFGGPVRIGLSLLLEILHSILMAPVMMVLQTGYILSVMSGRIIGWNGQNRTGRRLAVGQAFSHMAWVFAFGLALAVFLIAFAPDRMLWFLPLIVGPVLAPWLAIQGSSEAAGKRLAEAGLFLTPEESRPDGTVAPLGNPALTAGLAPARE